MANNLLNVELESLHGDADRGYMYFFTLYYDDGEVNTLGPFIVAPYTDPKIEKRRKAILKSNIKSRKEKEKEKELLRNKIKEDFNVVV